jgi:hypothetical protein
VIRVGARLALACVLLLGRWGQAQVPTVTIDGPTGNPLSVAAPVFTVRAQNFLAIDLPIRMQIQLATDANFSTGAMLADTIVDGTVATVAIPRLLPVGVPLYWRAVALTARVGVFPSVTVGPRFAGSHLTLVSPNNPVGQSLTTRFPTFTWRASTVPAPLPQWEFELTVEAAPLSAPVVVARTPELSFTAIEPLEANASYRWRLLARFPATGEELVVTSAASFVIRAEDAPLATLLYQNFPNPFPSAIVDRTCLWFDLASAGRVELDILDLRGQPVRRILPSARNPAPLPPGRYGRPASGAPGGCDEDFTWDGRTDDGRTVPPGIYMVRFRADGKQELRRIVFRGR